MSIFNEDDKDFDEEERFNHRDFVEWMMIGVLWCIDIIAIIIIANLIL